MDSMVLKKRKRDTEIGQDSGMAICASSSGSPTNHYIGTHRYQTPVKETPLSPLQNLSRIDCYGRLSSPPTNNRNRPCIRPIISPKKRRLDHKLAQLHAPSSAFPNLGYEEQLWGNEESIPSRTPFATEPYMTTTATATTQGPNPKATYTYIKQQQQQQQQSRNSQIKKNPNNTNTLSPCHICHRRPTTRAVLDAYADCELCSERTCYVCLRECNDVACRDPALRQILNSNDYGSTRGWDSASDTLDTGRQDASHVNGDSDGDTNVDPIGRRICSLCAMEGVTDNGSETVKCLVCVEGGRRGL